MSTPPPLTPTPPASTPGVGLAPWARVSAVAASLCAVHCLLTPILVPIVPLLAVGRSGELGMFALTVLLGGSVTLLGPGRRHLGVVGLLVLGTAVWWASLVGVFEPLPEAWTSTAGSLTFAGGMLWSARICRRGDCDVCGVRS